MVSRGEVAVAGRKGRERLWDLAERVYPDHPVLPRGGGRSGNGTGAGCAALGIARTAGPETATMEPAIVGEAPASRPRSRASRASGASTRPTWTRTSARPSTGRAALLSPFDRLVHDRVRALDIFEYEYQLEMYKPAAKRRWGYYALPVLYGDRLVGKLDATADRKAGVLTVNAIHQDVPFTTEMSAAIDAEIASLAAWLGLDAADRLTAAGFSRLREQVAGDGGRGHHVERVDPGGARRRVHRDAHRLVGLVQPPRGQPVPLGAEQQRDPPRVAQGARYRRGAARRGSARGPGTRRTSAPRGRRTSRSSGRTGWRTPRPSRP